jgi:hypothetical protein
MARKRNNEPNGTTTETRRASDWRLQFVDVVLSDEDKAALREWDREEGDFFAVVDGLVNRGYKVSVSYDYRNECFCFSVSGTKQCDVPANAGLCMVSRGSSVWKAYLAACFKLEVYCKNGLFPRPVPQQTLDFE